MVIEWAKSDIKTVSAFKLCFFLKWGFRSFKRLIWEIIYSISKIQDTLSFCLDAVILRNTGYVFVLIHFKKKIKKQSHFMQLLVLLSGQATEISVWARQASEEHLIANQGHSFYNSPPSTSFNKVSTQNMPSLYILWMCKLFVPIGGASPRISFAKRSRKPWKNKL